MKIHIDLSLMSETEAFGYVHGPIDLSTPPRSGDYLSLTGSGGVVGFPNVEGFTGRIKVISVTFWPNRTDGTDVSLLLDDVIVASRPDARKVAAYLEDNYSLFFDEFGEGQQ